MKTATSDTVIEMMVNPISREPFNAADIGGSPERLGLKGSPTSVKQIFVPQPRSGGLVFDATADGQRATDDFLNTFFDKDQVLLAELFSRKGPEHAQE